MSISNHSSEGKHGRIFTTKLRAGSELNMLSRPLFVVVKQPGVMWDSNPHWPVLSRKTRLVCELTLSNVGRLLSAEVCVVVHCYLGWFYGLLDNLRDMSFTLRDGRAVLCRNVIYVHVLSITCSKTYYSHSPP